MEGRGERLRDKRSSKGEGKRGKEKGGKERDGRKKGGEVRRESGREDGRELPPPLFEILNTPLLLAPPF